MPPPPNTLFPKQWSHMEAHLCCPGVRHFFVQTDVQVVAWLVGQEETNGNCLPGWCQPNVDLQLGLEDAEFPQATPVAHHHAPHRFFNLKTHKENVPHFQDTSTTSVPPPSCCSTGHAAHRRGTRAKEIKAPSHSTCPRLLLNPSGPSVLTLTTPETDRSSTQIPGTTEVQGQHWIPILSASWHLIPQPSTACPLLPLHWPFFLQV